jgi:pyruvate formate lyase activating enzyme
MPAGASREKRDSGGIKGYLPSSMLDWEGRIAAVLFFGNCDFRCPFCHNSDLVLDPGSLPDLSWKVIAAELAGKRDWLDGVVITGGEPALQNALPELVNDVRSLGLPVKLDSNGYHPEVLESLLGKGLLDYLAIDIKTSPRRYSEAAGREIDITRIERTVRLVIDSGLPHEFRSTVVPGLVGEEELDEIAAWVAGGRRLVLQQFRPDRTLDPRYLDVAPLRDDQIKLWAERCSSRIPTFTRGLTQL